MIIDVDSLPNPYLARFLDEGFAGVTPSMRKVLDEYPLAYGGHYPRLTKAEKRAVAPLRRAHLAAGHLPEDYDTLPDDARAKARMAVYTSWYDPRKQGELVNNVDNLIAGLYLYVELLLKTDEYTGGSYFMRDPKTKYDLVRQCMSPAKVATEAAKTVIVQSRGTTKTVTVIRQLCPFMAITRPYTEILVSEINDDRTSDELGLIREDIENCRLIHEEFGGYGKLWPKPGRNAKGKKWNEDELHFLRYPKCRICAYSIKSAQRGRHPAFAVWDDIEDNDTVKEKDHKQKIFTKLFDVYLGMLYRGGKFAWMGTGIRGSAIVYACRGANTRVDEFGDEDIYIDPRFDDFNKINNKMVRVDEKTGARESIMPDHTSVDAYDERLERWGAATVSAEMDGDPQAPGEFALIRDPVRHAYMHCQPAEWMNEHYFLDCNTGTMLPWSVFLEHLAVGEGCDPADSMDKTADCGAIVVAGNDFDMTTFVLDVFIEHLIADDWVERAAWTATEWGADRVGWETTAMQRVVLRMARRLARELEDKGLAVPKHVPVVNTGAKKYQRVLAALRPLYRKFMIRFPRFSPFTDGQGRTHVPVDQPNRKHFVELYRQLDTYTDEGAYGADDGPDALQICLRALGHRRGDKVVTKDTNEERLERLERLGFDVRQLVPAEHLPAKYREQEEPVPVQGGAEDWDDPYD